MTWTSPVAEGDTGDMGSIHGSGKTPWRRKWQLAPVFLPRKFHGQRRLAGHSPECCKQSEATEYTPICDLEFTIFYRI